MITAPDGPISAQSPEATGGTGSEWMDLLGAEIPTPPEISTNSRFVSLP